MIFLNKVLRFTLYAIRQKNGKNVDEIDPCCKFHQHFKHAFLPIFWRQKISKQKHFLIFGARILYEQDRF
jgi:hypothetical protein